MDVGRSMTSRASDFRYRHFVTEMSFPMSDLFVEIEYHDRSGVGIREIGVDANGSVVHRMPSDVHRFGDYGIFDNAMSPFPLDDEESDLTADAFGALWARPDLMPPPLQFRRVGGIVRRIKQELLHRPPFRVLRRAPRREL